MKFRHFSFTVIGLLLSLIFTVNTAQSETSTLSGSCIYQSKEIPFTRKDEAYLIFAKLTMTIDGKELTVYAQVFPIEAVPFTEFVISGAGSIVTTQLSSENFNKGVPLILNKVLFNGAWLHCKLIKTKN